MEDITKLSYKEVMQRIKVAKAHGTQIVNNKFGFIRQANDLAPNEIIRGRLFIFDGEHFVDVAGKTNTYYRYASFSSEFVTVLNLSNYKYEVYVENNSNNILNKIKPEARAEYYEIQLNEGIALLKSANRIFAISNNGHLRQLEKGSQSGKKYTVLPSRKIRSAYEIYQNSKILDIVDIDLNSVK